MASRLETQLAEVHRVACAGTSRVNDMLTRRRFNLEAARVACQSLQRASQELQRLISQAEGR